MLFRKIFRACLPDWSGWPICIIINDCCHNVSPVFSHMYFPLNWLKNTDVSKLTVEKWTKEPFCTSAPILKLSKLWRGQVEAPLRVIENEGMCRGGKWKNPPQKECWRLLVCDNFRISQILKHNSDSFHATKLLDFSCSRRMAAKEIWKAVAMADHFEKIQKLPDPVPGCPNFRRVPGYKVRANNGKRKFLD